MRRRLATLAALVLAAPAGAATYPAPSLSLQTQFSPPTGIARVDYVDQVTSTPAATAVSGGRIYDVGASGSGNSADAGIVAMRSDGTLDTGFSDDGKLVIAIGAGNTEDRAVDAAVLPDGRLRVLALTGAAGSARDSVLIGLMPDGTPDASFGASDDAAPGGITAPGIVALGIAGGDTPTALAVASDGRLGVTGDAIASGNDDTFVAVRLADGSPDPSFADATGKVVLDRSGSSTADSGVDVAFRPGGGVLVLGQIGAPGSTGAFVRAFTDAGAVDPGFSDDGDLLLEVGDAPVMPTSMLLYGGRLWITGSARTGVDTNAFLARVGLDGAGLQSRQFDMRGQLLDPAAAVTSVGNAVTVVPGTPDTLVVAGSVASSGGTDWAAAAFNNLDSDVASLGFGDIAISIPGSGGINGAADGGGAAAVSGPYQETSSSAIYTRTGIARLLVDADKTCDLQLTVTRPLELLLAPGATGNVGLSVTNRGTRACGGSVDAAAPFKLAGGLVATGVLAPGETFTAAAVALADGGTLRQAATAAFTLTAPGDVDASNNTASLGVRFRYCDLTLTRAGSAAFIPNEGARRFAFSVRNGGTIPCSAVRVGVSGTGRAGRANPRYSVRAGRDVADEVATRAPAGAAIGTTVTLTFTPQGAEADANPFNNPVTLTPVVLGVGDTDAKRPRGAARVLSGIARGGRGTATARLRRVTKVDVAVRRLGGKGCSWLSAAKQVRFRTRAMDSRKRCLRPVWLRTGGTRRWLLRTSGLPRGRYVLLSRATIGAGFPEASFTVRDGNRVAFHVGS